MVYSSYFILATMFPNIIWWHSRKYILQFICAQLAHSFLGHLCSVSVVLDEFVCLFIYLFVYYKSNIIFTKLANSILFHFNQNCQPLFNVITAISQTKSPSRNSGLQEADPRYDPSPVLQGK